MPETIPYYLTEAWVSKRRERRPDGYYLAATFGPEGETRYAMAWRTSGRERAYDAGSPRLRHLPWYCSVEVENGAMEHGYHRTLAEAEVWAFRRHLDGRADDLAAMTGGGIAARADLIG
jgi:hypothetical protein